jgi:major outer membrane protein
MKNTCFVFSAIFSMTSLYALYNGNPSAPDIIDEALFSCQDNFFVIKAGYQGDYVFDRKLAARKGITGRMDQSQIGMNQGVLTLNLQDRFEIYGSVGAMNAFLSDRPHVDGQRRQYETHDELTWGVGGRCLIVPFKNIDFGVDACYQYANPHLAWNAINGVAYKTRGRLKYEEWQVGLGLSYHIDFFTPYLAVKYSNVWAKMSHIRPDILPVSHFKMKSREHFGLALGCTLSNGKIFDLTGEVRLFDEQAVSVAGNIKF